MIASRLPKKLPRTVAVLLVIALVISLLLGNSEVCTGIGLLLVAGAMLYLKQMENVSERTVAQRIKAEYPSEIQPQVFGIYEHMKIKEFEGLFLKILDDSNGDVKKVEKLASIAESVGWRAFLENHW